MQSGRPLIGDRRVNSLLKECAASSLIFLSSEGWVLRCAVAQYKKRYLKINSEWKILALIRDILRGILGDFGTDWETKIKFVFKEGLMDVNWINGA
jgi:hypothetical protein